MSQIIPTCKKWDTIIKDIVSQQKTKDLISFVNEERKSKIIYPDSNQVLNAFIATPFDSVKVVILGQDPYHNGSAHGLAFSSMSKTLPESLRNIYKEIQDDYFSETKDPCFYGSNLRQWASQGVLLLNTILTVEKGKPLSHQDKGWEDFTRQIIEQLNKKEKLVYLLWGKNAQKYQEYISVYHYVLTAAHPSPYSANQGFFGCRHFSKTNQILTANQNGSNIGINWGIWKN